MGDFNASYNDRVQFWLTHREFGQILIAEPKGWDDDRLIFKRNSVGYGIINEFSNNLEFYGESKIWLRDVYDFYGVEADVNLTKKVLELDTSIGAAPNSLLWFNSYTGTLDFDTMVETQYFTKIKFNSSSLIRKIKSKESDDIELERLTDLYNNTINKIDVKTMALNGKELLFVTKYKRSSSLTTYQAFQSSGAPNEAMAIPFRTYANSGDRTQNAYEARIELSGSSYTNAVIGNMFYLNSLNNVTLKLEVGFTVSFWSNSSNSVWLDIVTYNNGEILDYKSTQNLVTHNYSGGGSGNVETITYNQTINVSVLTNESLAFSLKSQGTGDMHYIFSEATTNLVVTYNSYFDPSQSNFVFAHDMFAKLFEIIGGVNTPFESNYLGSISNGYKVDGEGALIGVASGKWIRGFDAPITTDDTDEYKSPTISLKDALKSIEATLALSYGVKTLNNKEVAFIEPIDFFFQPTIVIKLPNQIQNVERSIHSKLNYTSLSFGYKKPNDAVDLYNEAHGLDEPNIKNSYSTPLTKTDNKYIQESKIRADGTGAELARRKQRSQFPTTDTRFDLDNWWFNLKVSGNSWVEKLWADVFAVIPTGIYSPETATKLLFSPINMMLRHAKIFGAGLLKNSSDYVMYGSSLSNSNLRTQLIGGIEIGESDNILISNFARPRLKADKIKFEHNVNDELLRLLKSNTTIKDENGNEQIIPTFYFKVQFLNENKEWETGYIDSVEPKGAGKWELILANDNLI